MLDDLFHALADEHRRQIIECLSERNGMKLEEIAEDISINRDYEDTLTVLKHNHLPILVESGVINYEMTDGIVKRGSDFEEALDVLQVVADDRHNSRS